MNEIVAGLIDGHILTNSVHKLRLAAEAHRRIEWQTRQKMQFMADCDLGERWDALASGKTLFCLTDEGAPIPPNNQI